MRVGSKIIYDFGGRDVHGVVLEDRGYIGVDRERFLRIRLDVKHVSEPIEFEVPEAKLRVA